MLSAWCVVLVSVERFIAVWMPMKAKMINTKKHLLIVISLLVVFFTVLNGYWCSFADRIKNG